MTSANATTPQLEFPISRVGWDSRGPILPFSRGCEVFTSERGLELSSLFTIHPAQVYRILNRPLNPAPDDDGATEWKEFRYAIEGEHKLSPTTLKNVSAHFPFAGDMLDAIQKGEGFPGLETGSLWVAYGLGLSKHEQPPEPWLGATVGFLSDLERAADAALNRLKAGDKRKAEVLLLDAHGCNPLEQWRNVLPPSSLAMFPLSSGLTALALADVTSAQAGEESTVLQLLASGATPFSRWLRWVCDAYDARNLSDLERKLAARDVLLDAEGHRPRRITSNRLRKWANGTDAMRWPSVKALLSGLPNEQGQRLGRAQALSRCATFLVDAVSAYSELALTWKQAQAAVHARYADAYRAST